jgi:hypothetical protein
MTGSDSDSDFSVLKMEASRSSEMSVTIYQTIQHLNLQDNNLHIESRRTSNFYKFFKYLKLNKIVKKQWWYINHSGVFRVCVPTAAEACIETQCTSERHGFFSVPRELCSTL